MVGLSNVIKRYPRRKEKREEERGMKKKEEEGEEKERRGIRDEEVKSFSYSDTPTTYGINYVPRQQGLPFTC